MRSGRSSAREGGTQQDPKAVPTPPEIYGFGFSRGAFTIRVLAGLVIRQGLVPHASESEMRRMALLSYRAYRKQCFHTKTRIEVPFRNIRDAIAKLLDRTARSRRIRSGPQDPQMVCRPRREQRSIPEA